jgi:tetratricopeptide (TPR) repeat protein
VNPGQREAYRLGRLGFEHGDAGATVEQLEKLIPACQEWADVHYMLGIGYERQGDLPSAAHSLEEALRINPRYAEARLALSSVYESQGEFDRSRQLTEQTRTLMPAGEERLDPTTRGKLANLHAALGDAYREAGELREAIEAYRKALDRCPEYHDIRVRLGVTLRDAGHPDRAIRELVRVRRAHPQLLDAGVQLGLTLYTLGRSDEAIEHWRAVLERDPSRDDARTYIRMVRTARTDARPAEEEITLPAVPGPRMSPEG